MKKKEVILGDFRTHKPLSKKFVLKAMAQSRFEASIAEMLRRGRESEDGREKGENRF